jgi:hypothetical protein
MFFTFVHVKNVRHGKRDRGTPGEARVDHAGRHARRVSGLRRHRAARRRGRLETDPFWIANVIYLGFVLSAVLGSATKIAGYRGGFQTW